MKELLDQGANPAYINPDNGRTVLLAATQRDDLQIASVLLKAGECSSLCYAIWWMGMEVAGRHQALGNMYLCFHTQIHSVRVVPLSELWCNANYHGLF